MAKYASTIITGNLGEGDVNASKHVRDVTPGLHGIYADNDQAPLLALLSKIQTKRKARNIKHEWAKKDLYPRWMEISTVDANNGTATVTVTFDSAYGRIGDTVEFFGGTGGATTYGVLETNPSGNQFTVNSLDGTALLPTLAAGNKVHILSIAAEELSNSPAAKNVQDEFDYNYPQFLRYPTTIGILELGTLQYTGDERTERVREQMMEIKMSFERLLHFGERGKQTGVGGETQVFMRGTKRFTEVSNFNNVWNWGGGSMTEAQFREYLMEGPCKYGSKQKFFPMSSDLWLQIDGWAGTKQAVQAAGGPINIYGISFQRYMAPNGKILMMHHHHMYEEEYEGAGQILDLQGMGILPFGNHPMFSFHPNIQDNDVAGEKFEWRTIATLEVLRPEWNGYIYA